MEKRKKELALEGVLKNFDSSFIPLFMKTWKVPGLAVAVIKLEGNDFIVRKKVFGFRNIEKRLPVTEDTLFPIGSCTKGFTSASAGILVDEKKIMWDDPIKKYISWFKMSDPYATMHATIRDALSHKTGLPRHDNIWGLHLQNTRIGIIKSLEYLNFSNSFREKPQYNNLVYTAAGYVIGQASRTSWENFVETRIFRPLGMKRSNFSIIDTQKTTDYALPYEEIDGGIKKTFFQNNSVIGPAGSINSNISEMVNWIITLLNNGRFNNKQVIKKERLAELFAPQVVLDSEKKYPYPEFSHESYGLGWFISSYKGNPWIYHGGGISGFSARIDLFPDQKLGVVSLSNLFDIEDDQLSFLAVNILERVLGEKQKNWSAKYKEYVERKQKAAEIVEEKERNEKKTPAPPTVKLKDVVGNFKHSAYGVMKIVVVKGEIRWVWGILSANLRHYTNNVFKTTKSRWLVNGGVEDDVEIKMEFKIGTSGKVESIVVLELEENVNNVVFKKLF